MLNVILFSDSLQKVIIEQNSVYLKQETFAPL